ncbi:hypothetical protein ColLi_08091 [Colletotrichum liriopes]|uniref:DUF2306 domain-containing protein n=1 Tax=Colletotrichum liriopes TaxID=708192 RepID=A0AA37GSB0_9PEZI|nr:hypothetical protein ColLi_08091 [Colletotrichum liriopes]
MSSTPPRSKPPANGFVALARKVYNPIGFKKGYNFTLFVITVGGMMGFALARMMYFNIDGVFCNPDHKQRTLPGECYFYQSGTGRAGIIMHLVGMVPGGFLACLQFVPVIRHKALLFHRINGYLVLLLSVVGITGVLMIVRRTFGGGVSMQTVMGAGSIMFLGALGLSIYNIKKLQIEQHRAWMLRAWVYAGFIITMRIISFLAVMITADSGYYQVKQCAVLDFIFRHNQTKVLDLYPGCGGYYSGESPGLNVIVHSNYHAHQPAEIAAGFTSVFDAGSWLALAIHAILVELYLEAGMKNAGNAGLTVQRLGDAEPWLPPVGLQRSEHSRTPSSDEEMREKSTGPPEGLADLEAALDGLIRQDTAVTDNDLVLSPFGAPLVALLVKVAGGVLGLDIDRDVLALARCKRHLCEALELLEGPVDLGLLFGRDIDLHNLSALHLARVLDGDVDGDLAVLLCDLEFAEAEARVRQAMAEREENGAVDVLVVAIADVNVLAIQRAAGLGAVVEVGWVVLDTLGEAEGELGRGVDVAEEHVGDGVACLVAAVPCLDEGFDVLNPWHAHGGSRLVDDDGIGVRLGDGRDELVEVARQVHVGAVVALCLPVGIEAGADDDLVCVLGEGSGLGDLGLVINDLAAADAQGAAAEYDIVALQLGRRGRGELDLKGVRLTLLKLNAALLLKGCGTEEGVALALLGAVVDDQLVVDKEVGRAADDETELVGAVLLSNEGAFKVGVPEVGLELGVVIVDKQQLRLGQDELVEAFAVVVRRGLVVGTHRHTGLAVGRLADVAQ